MSQILKANSNKSNCATMTINEKFTISFKPGEVTDIILASGKRIKTACINCQNPMCTKLRDEEITCDDFKEIAHEMNRTVCPVDAIKSGIDSIQIDKSKCIGCGLCASRCPIGAIYVKDGKGVVSTESNHYVKAVSNTSDGNKEQEAFIQKAVGMKRTGSIQKENNTVMELLYKSIKRMDQTKQNILARNLLIQLGNNSTLSRQGNVYMRMDGFYDNSIQYGVVEIETGADMLDVSRALLDDVAVINTRYNVQKDKNHPLAIVLGLPNKRTDYWQVVKDIREVVNLQINTITFGALLILLWNNVMINDFDEFYIDVDNSSIREVVKDKIGRSCSISDGTLGVLENSK